MRLPPRAGERIDRTRALAFSFGDETVEAFAGDTIGSALFASGRRIFSRSFKYHRARDGDAAEAATRDALLWVLAELQLLLGEHAPAEARSAP